MFWFFFFQLEEPSDLDSGSVGWDPILALKLKARVLSARRAPRDEVPVCIGHKGNAEFHALHQDVPFWLVGYFLHFKWPDHDEYLTLLQFEDGVYQIALVNLCYGDTDYLDAFYSGFFTSNLESRFTFIDDGAWYRYQQLPKR
ncbi:hypothetical protein [Tumebacillus flagellatus]|uniref:Uncharacterized protein n=1 Tax=Tumebacillus flagellatus TaxID=1157490 RepID=A0A074LXF1_9BACL|nr:hypothetical protein [Tumebacillus flagellatus]KEO84783.1 hypothetical protein EL26_01875 [Tumebacillus flagellatus]